MMQKNSKPLPRHPTLHHALRKPPGPPSGAAAPTCHRPHLGHDAARLGHSQPKLHQVSRSREVASRVSNLVWRQQLRLSFRPGRQPRVLVRHQWSATSFPWAAWVAGGWFVRRRGSVASGAMSGRRPRMLVQRSWSASGLLGAAWAVGGPGVGGGISRRRPRKVVQVVCAGCDGGLDVGAAASSFSASSSVPPCVVWATRLLSILFVVEASL